MGELKNRAVIGVLGMALSFTLIACDTGDDPADTTSSGDPATTEPLGS